MEGLMPAGTDVSPHLHPPLRLHLQSPHPAAKHPKSLEEPPQSPLTLSQAAQKEGKPPKAAALSSPGGHRPGTSLGTPVPGGAAGEAEPATILGVTLNATASPNPRHRPARMAPAPRQAGSGPSLPNPCAPTPVRAAFHPAWGDGSFGGAPLVPIPLPPPKATAAAQGPAGPRAEPAPLQSRRTPAHDVGSCRIADAALPGAPPGPAPSSPPPRAPAGSAARPETFSTGTWGSSGP